ncbi:MAG: RNase adapter RapZ [Pseudomonadota bacterium]
MRLVIVSGLSGSGKSVALRLLEDVGYYCIDNLPVTLLGRLTEELLAEPDGRGEKTAIGIDARTHDADVQVLGHYLDSLRKQGHRCEVLFLQATDDILLKRYSESRRRHPLADQHDSLRDAIASEREQLLPIVNLADLIIDTTRTSVYELRDLVRERVAPREPNTLSILIESFGYKHGIPTDADYVFDLRCLPNPYWEPELRPQTGLDHAVAQYLERAPLVNDMHDGIVNFILEWLPRFEDFSRSYLTIAVGCTGGQHRSVYMAERIARSLRASKRSITVRHHGLLSRGDTSIS